MVKKIKQQMDKGKQGLAPLMPELVTLQRDLEFGSFSLSSAK